MTLRIETARVPVERRIARCEQCGIYSDEFPLAGGGAGGDFDTWASVSSGTVYRVDTTLYRYGVYTFDQCQAAVFRHAGGESEVRRLPHEVFCKNCGTTFHVKSCEILGEEDRAVRQLIAE